PADIRHQADLHPCTAEPRIGGGDGVVAGGHERDARPHTVAFHRHYEGLGPGDEQLEKTSRQIKSDAPLDDPATLHLTDITARAQIAARTGQHNGTTLLIVDNLEQARIHRLPHLHVESIEALRVVHRHDGDVAVIANLQDLFVACAHCRPSPNNSVW